MELNGVVKKIMESDELKAKLQNFESFDTVYEFFVANGYEGGKSELKDKLFKNSAPFGTLTGDDLMHVSGGISGRRAFLACSGLMILMGLLPATNLSGYSASATMPIQTKVNDAEMWEAMRNKDFEKLKYFIKQGADVDRGLWDAVRFLADFDLVNFFVKNHANVNIKQGSWTLLHVSKNPKIINYLVNHGANINAKDDSGQTPLHWACGGLNIELAKCLLENGADVNSKDEYGNVPLVGVVNDASAYEQGLRSSDERNAMAMLKFLIENGADVNAKDNYGETPLYKAAIYGAVDVFRYLVDHGADIKTTDNDGKPLYLRVSEYLDAKRRAGNGKKICEGVQSILEYILSQSTEK